MPRVYHPKQPRHLSLAFPGVAEAAAAEFGFRAKELTAGGKLGSLALSHARAVAMWLCFQTGDVSYPALAEMFGVTYPSCRARVKAIALRRSKSPKFRELCDRCEAAVEQRRSA